MRRGSTAGFWKMYEATQLSMAASCMPKTALVSGVNPTVSKEQSK